MAVNHGRPDGQAAAADVLRVRVMAMLDARCRCDRQSEAAVALPELIRDVHTSISAGRDVAKLLDLTVLLHTQGTSAWLRVVGCPAGPAFSGRRLGPAGRARPDDMATR